MPTSKIIKTSLLITIVFLLVSFLPQSVYGGCSEIDDLDDRAECYANKIEDKQDEYESTSKKLDDLRNKKDQIADTISGFQSELNVTQAQIDELQAQIDEISEELALITENLTDRRSKLIEKIKFRDLVIRNYSKKSFTSDLEFFFSISPFETDMSGFQYLSTSYMIRKYLTDDAVRWIYILNSEIDTFEDDKLEAQNIIEELEGTQNQLLALKYDLDNKKASAQNEFGDLENKEGDYEDKLFDLQTQISELSSKQQSILNQKYGTGTGSVGDYEPTEVKTPDPPFKPAFAAFSYGAYTHYKGMSQYGAKGRAKDGQDYKDIVEFYYGEDVKEKDDFPSKICVQGYGDMDFQKYLYGLAEMPSSWDGDALKAQAIAGRSYAYRYAKKDLCICTDQGCQVFLKSKSDNPPDRWKDAVDDTEDKIIDGSTDASGYGWYSSTAGGYIENRGWDTDCGSSSCWPDDAYEDEAGSPWFRKAWYTKSYNDSSNCGRNHPWLDEEEMADIVNAWVVWTHGSSSERDHISPVTTSCWGGDPYSLGEMRDKADKYGKNYEEVYSIDVDVSNGGYTSQVTLQTNEGSVSIDGQTFKTVFNLRAPSYVAIRSRLFDFEKED
ncbi:SpoIID/LytB domain-containing protein [Patescibacteria group bacterium]